MVNHLAKHLEELSEAEYAYGGCTTAATAPQLLDNIKEARGLLLDSCRRIELIQGTWPCLPYKKNGTEHTLHIASTEGRRCVEELLPRTARTKGLDINQRVKKKAQGRPYRDDQPSILGHPLARGETLVGSHFGPSFTKR